MRQKRRKPLKPLFVMLSLCVMLIFVLLLAVNFGSTAIPLDVVARILLNGSGLFHFAVQWDPTIDIIIWQVRLPVVVGAALVGAALAVAGALYQGMLRNPLADPFLIGTSSGAALGATIAFVLPFDTLAGSFFSLTPLLAFVGAIVTVLFVYTIARTGGQTPVVTLLLAGVVVNAILVALQTLILTLRPPAQMSGLQGLFNWLSGGISVSSWPPLLIVALIILPGILCAIGLANSTRRLCTGRGWCRPPGPACRRLQVCHHHTGLTPDGSGSLDQWPDRLRGPDHSAPDALNPGSQTPHLIAGIRPRGSDISDAGRPAGTRSSGPCGLASRHLHRPGRGTILLILTQR